MTEPVAALSAVRPPDRNVRGLPMPQPPRERWLRPRRDPATFVLWLAIVGAMVTSASFFSHLPIVVVGIIAAGVIGGLSLVGVRNKRFSAKNEEALAFLSAGEVEKAESLYLDLARRYYGNLGVIAAHNVAVCRMRRGDGQSALAILGEMEAKKAFDSMPQLHTSVPLMIALEYVQLGDVEAARVWLEHAKKRKGAKTTVLVEAAILLRQRQYNEAAALLAEHWRTIESTMSAEMMRPWRIRRAFAVKNAGGSEQEVSELVAGAKPFKKGEYDALAVHWPEMQAFLVESRLV